MTIHTPRLPGLMLIALLASATTATLAALPAEPAAAAEYTVNVCRTNETSFTNRGFVKRRRGRNIAASDRCPNQGRGARGLLINDGGNGGKVPFHGRASWTMRAPAGTHFRRVAWAGRLQRDDCGFELQVYADEGALGADKLIPLRFRRGVKTHSTLVAPGKDCPKPGRAQTSGDSPLLPVQVGDATAGPARVVLRMECRSKDGCAARGRNYIQTTGVSAVVVDNSAPQAAIITGPGGTAFTNGAWTNGKQLLPYTANDTTGISRAVAADSGDQRACDYGKATPCTTGAGTINFDTGQLGEGTQLLAVTAFDAAGNAGGSGPVVVRIDRTPPARVDVAVDGGEGWRNTPDFGLGWANPAEGDRAPITAVRYRVDGGAEQRQPGDAIARLGITAPAPGEHTVALWREDQAGNHQPENASAPVTLRYDPEPPQPAFDALSASDPTRISVAVTDRVSGLAGGQIEISRDGSNAWQPVATQQEGQHLVARLDDSQLAAGRYLLRARAYDQARNEASTDRRADGQPMVIDAPLRIASRLRTGIAKKKVVRRKVGRRGKRRTVRRRITVFDSRRRVRLGRKVKISGRLTNPDGQPIAGAQVAVTSRDAVTPEKLVAYVTTGKQGRYNYTARASSSRTLRFVYPGDGLTLPAQHEVKLVVGATSSIHLSHRHRLTGQKVTFRGRLRAPKAGKLVELQVHVKGGWQTFRTDRTGPNSRWRIRYKFARTCGLNTYRFRVRIPHEAGYPYATGASPTTTAQVRGLPCRQQ